MKRALISIAAALSLVVAGCSGGAEKKSRDERDTVATQANSDVAEKSQNSVGKLVSASGLPMVVDFSAEWCPPCRQLKPVFHALGEEYKGNVEFMTVNVDSMPELAQKYDVSSIPTLVYISRNGKELYRSVGLQTAEDIRSAIDKNLK